MVLFNIIMTNMKKTLIYERPVSLVNKTQLRTNLLAGSNTTTPNTDGKTGDFGYDTRARHDIGVD